MSSKFEEFEKERLERQARIAELESKVHSWSTKVEKLEYTADKMEQYSRCNSILIHGLPEEKGEDTGSLVIETVKEKMGLDISSADIDGTHKFATPPKQPGLYGMTTGEKIYINKKILKRAKISITESLTTHRIAKLKEAKEKLSFKTVWNVE